METNYSKTKLNLSTTTVENGIEVQYLIGFDTDLKKYVKVAHYCQPEWSNTRVMFFRHGYFPPHKLGLKAIKRAKADRVEVFKYQ